MHIRANGLYFNCNYVHCTGNEDVYRLISISQMRLIKSRLTAGACDQSGRNKNSRFY